MRHGCDRSVVEPIQSDSYLPLAGVIYDEIQVIADRGRIVGVGPDDYRVDGP